MDFKKTMDKAIKACDVSNESWTVYKGKVGSEKFGTVGDFRQALEAAKGIAKKLNKSVTINKNGTNNVWVVNPDGSFK